MLSLTRKTDYALVALSHLGSRRRDDARPVSAREIADRFELPPSLLMNILKELGNAGLLNSTRGSNGGYELAVDPAAVSLMDVVAAIEGPVRITTCCQTEPTDATHLSADVAEACSLEDRCPIREPIHRLHERIHRFLAQVTLADLLDDADASAVTSACCCGSSINTESDPGPLVAMPVLETEAAPTCCSKGP